MPKNKRHKYERVKQLPNVTILEGDGPTLMEMLPWNRNGRAGLPRILELGCGKGEYSLALAAANPHSLIVGVDYKSHRICVGAEKALARELDNVHFLRARVEDLREFFHPRSIHAIWLTFPDPHLKNRKAKSRLTAASFLDLYAELLIPEGVVHLQTDSARLYHYSRESVQDWGGQVLAVCEDMHAGGNRPLSAPEETSAYEEAALLQGKTIKYLAFSLA